MGSKDLTPQPPFPAAQTEQTVKTRAGTRVGSIILYLYSSNQLLHGYFKTGSRNWDEAFTRKNFWFIILGSVFTAGKQLVIFRLTPPSTSEQKAKDVVKLKKGNKSRPIHDYTVPICWTQLQLIFFSKRQELGSSLYMWILHHLFVVGFNSNT